MRAIIILIILSTYTLLFGVNAGEQLMPSETEISAVKAIKTRHEKRLMTLPGVVSVGIGKNKQGNLAIAVGVNQPSASTLSSIPETLEGYPVVLQDTGKPKAQSKKGN